MGQAVPEIHLSVGSKLELYTQSFCLANQFPYTSPYTHAFVRLSCIEAPRVLHFSAAVYIYLLRQLKNGHLTILYMHHYRMRYLPYSR